MAESPNDAKSPGGSLGDSKKAKEGIDALRASFARLGDVTGRVWGKAARDADEYARNAKKAADHTETLGRRMRSLTTGAIAVAGAAYAVKGLVMAGLEGSATAQMLSFHFQQLSRGIAAVFLPVVQAVSDKIRDLSQWFHGLSESQQNTIMRLGVLAAGLAGTILILPRLAAAFTVVKAAITGMLAATGVGALLPILGLVVGLVMDLATAADFGDSVFGQLWATVKEVFTSIWKFAQPLVSSLVASFKGLGEQVKSLFSSLAETLKPALEVIGRVVVAAIVTPLKWVVDAIRYLIAAAQVLWREGIAASLSDPKKFLKDVQAEIDAADARAKGKGGGKGREVSPGFGQMEDASALFKRIQSGGYDSNKKTADNTAATAEACGQLNNKVDRLIEETVKMGAGLVQAGATAWGAGIGAAVGGPAGARKGAAVGEAVGGQAAAVMAPGAVAAWQDMKHGWRQLMSDLGLSIGGELGVRSRSAPAGAPIDPPTH